MCFNSVRIYFLVVSKWTFDRQACLRLSETQYAFLLWSIYSDSCLNTSKYKKYHLCACFDNVINKKNLLLKQKKKNLTCLTICKPKQITFTFASLPDFHCKWISENIFCLHTLSCMYLVLLQCKDDAWHCWLWPVNLIWE